MKTVVVSQNDVHPYKKTLSGKEGLVLVFGLKGSRGDNKVYCNHPTTKLTSVLRKEHLSNYNESDMVVAANPTVEYLKSRFGFSVTLVGISKNVRRTWTSKRYRSLISNIAKVV